MAGEHDEGSGEGEEGRNEGRNEGRGEAKAKAADQEAYHEGVEVAPKVSGVGTSEEAEAGAEEVNAEVSELKDELENIRVADAEAIGVGTPEEVKKARAKEADAEASLLREKLEMFRAKSVEAKDNLTSVLKKADARNEELEQRASSAETELSKLRTTMSEAKKNLTSALKKADARNEEFEQRAVTAETELRQLRTTMPEGAIDTVAVSRGANVVLLVLIAIFAIALRHCTRTRRREHRRHMELLVQHCEERQKCYDKIEQLAKPLLKNVAPTIASMTNAVPLPSSSGAMRSSPAKESVHKKIDEGLGGLS